MKKIHNLKLKPTFSSFPVNSPGGQFYIKLDDPAETPFLIAPMPQGLKLDPNVASPVEIRVKRVIDCVNAMAGIEDPIKMRETWDVVKELELDAYHKLKQEHDQFIELVRAMRDNQKEYFRNRTRESLLQSKELERQVDLLLLPTDKRIQQTELYLK